MFGAIPSSDVANPRPQILTVSPRIQIISTPIGTIRSRADARIFGSRRKIMPGTKYTKKRERKADHIEKSYEKKGVSKKEAESRAWATVNKQDGGGKKKGGSGHKKSH